MRPREFLSLILILTSKTDQEFCSHHFNVNLRSLGPKMADLPLFSRNGPVDGAKIGPREFLSAILVLTSKTDQEFCSHHFNVNLSFLGPKLAELPLFFRIGLITSSVELEMRRRVFLLGNPILTSKTNYFFSSHHFDPNLRSLGPKLSVLEPFLVLAKIVKNRCKSKKKVKPTRKCWF